MEEPWHTTWWWEATTYEREYAQELFERDQDLREQLLFVRTEFKRLRARCVMRQTRARRGDPLPLPPLNSLKKE